MHTDPRLPGPLTPAQTRRAAGLVRALEQLLTDSHAVLAAVAADPAGAGARAPELRRHKDAAARLLRELETLVPPEGSGSSAP